MGLPWTDARKKAFSKQMKKAFKLKLRVPWSKGKKIKSYKVTKKQKKMILRAKIDASNKSFDNSKISWAALNRSNYSMKNSARSHFNG